MPRHTLPLAVLSLLILITGVFLPGATSASAPTPGSHTRTAAPPPPKYLFPVRLAAPLAGRISYGPYHHDYPATDIFCPAGSLFLAPTSGTVDYVSTTDLWDPQVNDGATRGGLSVAIVGDDGVRYYGSHLSSVARGIVPGARVQAGRLLGKTGNSGDARITAPHLHFGISRPTTPDDWQVRRGEVSPYLYLVIWHAGRSLKPILPPTTAR